MTDRNHIPAVHILHTKNNVSRFVLEGSVKGDDVRGIAVMPDLQLAQDLLPHILLGVYADNLVAYDQGCRVNEREETVPSWP